MRIGIFIDTWREGGNRVFLNRLEAHLTRRGHKVVFFLAEDYPVRLPAAKASFQVLQKRLGERCVSLHLWNYPTLRWQTHVLKEALCREKIECLFLNEYRGITRHLRSIGSSFPLISIAHSDSDYYYDEFLALEPILSAHVCVSRAILGKCQTFTPPARRNRLIHIPCGTDYGDDFLECPTGSLHVVYCARLDFWQKRVGDLIPIWKTYQAREGNGRLTVLGGGEALNYLRDHFRGEIQGGTVRVLGEISPTQTHSEMMSGDVILNISNWEGLPQAVVEGAGLGLYPVLSRIQSGHDEIIRAVGAGSLCEVGDIDAFAHEILCLQNRLEELRSNRSALRERTLGVYHIDRCVDRYEELFGHVILEQKQRPPQYIPSPYRPLLWERRRRIQRQWIKNKQVARTGWISHLPRLKKKIVSNLLYARLAFRTIRTGKKSILLVRRGGLGDMLCCLPLYHALRVANPGRNVLFLTTAENFPLAKAGGAAAQALAIPKYFNPRMTPLHGKFIDQIIHPRAIDEERTTPPPRRDIHLADAFLEHAGLSFTGNYPSLRCPSPLKRRIAQRLGVEKGKGLRIAIHTGRTWPVREWPEEHWQELVKGIAARYQAVIYHLCYSLNHSLEHEARLFDLEGTVPLHNLLSPQESMGLLASMDLFIGIDSGPLHLAGALGIPTWGIFGAVNPALRMRQQAHASFVRLDCSFCHNKEAILHWRTGCPNGIACMNALTAEHVLSDLSPLLDRLVQDFNLCAVA